MSSTLQAQVDALRSEVQSLSQAVQELQAMTHHVAPLLVQRTRNSMAADATQDGRLAPAHELARLAQNREFAGLITYAGAYTSGKRDYLWVTEARTSEDLLAQDEDAVAQVLAALGNKQRLMLLKAILEQPASASELVNRLGMGTTGQVYHHLKPLQAADLVTQEERGQFVFKGHRVQGLLMLLAGVLDLLDSHYSVGTWETGSASVERSE